MASYAVNPDAVARARQLIDSRQIVLDSDWGKVQPGASEQNAFLESHSWGEYAQWHLGLTEGASEQTKARYAFVYGDFRRVHRMGIIACQYRAAEWRHKEIELAAHDLLQRLDNKRSQGRMSRPGSGGNAVPRFPSPARQAIARHGVVSNAGRSPTGQVFDSPPSMTLPTRAARSARR